MRRRAAAWGAALVMLAGLLIAGPTQPAVAASDPTTWNCGSDKVDYDGDTVQLAPIRSVEKDVDGGAVQRMPDSRGRYVPVVMVHGWTGRSTNDEEGAFSHLIDLSPILGTAVVATRSLIGQLQKIPGAAVFTFDYHSFSSRWVDDSHLGPALGTLVDCLFRASGEKVIIVGHSMGGLVARYAATHAVAAPATERAAEISTVVTFGTPELGSWLALLGAVGLDIGAAESRILAVIRLILSVCGQLASVEIETGTLCDWLPAFVRAFASDAGKALRYGSKALVDLKPFPGSIAVEALAGRTTFKVPAGWFSLHWSTNDVEIGDIIVTADSATAGATTNHWATCAYQLNVVRGVSDQIGLVFGLVAQADIAQQPLMSFGGPCFHTGLMRDILLTNQATGTVNEDIAGRTSPVPDSSATLVSYIQAGKMVNANDYHSAAPGPGQPFESTYGIAEFMTPSRNIYCGISTDPGSHGVACHIDEYSFADPPHNDCGPVLFFPDWFSVSESGVDRGACLGGAPFLPYSNVLPYGSTIQQGDIACRSESAFLACADIKTHKGFVVNKMQFRAYP